MGICEHNNPLIRRNVDVERKFLLSLNDLDYSLLQRDWNSGSHGDLDMVVSSKDWTRLVKAITDFSGANNMPVVKVYEIEHATVCIILLASTYCIHLDVCICPYRKSVFDVDLETVIQSRELKEGIYILRKDLEDHYKTVKKEYKKSPLAKMLNKMRNSTVLARRLLKTSICIRGALIHIPYVHDTAVLRSIAVTQSARNYLTGELIKKYGHSP